MVVEYVADVEAAKRFYVDVLGLDVEQEHPTFIQFKDEAGSRYAIASDAPLGSGEPEVYWHVADAEAAYRALSPTAKISRPLEQMPFGKVFAVTDPAGRPQYLYEPALAQPSQSAQ
jgi:predicted enzyme related to lactoylglutathione lyase